MRIGIESGSAWSIIAAPIERMCWVLLLIWTSGKTLPPVTPPPVFWPSEPLKMPACSNSKKSGSRAGEAAATSSKRKIRLAALIPVGFVYVHALPGAPPAGNVSPKQALIFPAVPAEMAVVLTPAIMSAWYTGSVVAREALGPLYVIQANRLNGNRVLTRGSPTAAVVPSKRVKLVATRRDRKFGLTAVEVFASAA